MPNPQFSEIISERPGSSRKKNLIIRWVGTLLALALLIYLLSRVGWVDIAQAVRQITLWRFILCLFMMLLSRLAVAGRWHMLLRSAEVDITFRQTLKVTFAGLFASNFLPTTIGGDVVRLGGIIQLGFDRTLSIASLIVDRLVGMAGMASALPFMIPALIKYQPGADTNLLYSTPLLLALLAQSDSWWAHLKEKTKNALRRFFLVLSIWLKQPKSLTSGFAITWMHQLFYFGQIWLLLTGMGDPLPIWSIAGLWAATYFVTLLPVSVNGLGMQELSATFFFTTVGGVSLENSLTLAMLFRALQTLASLPGALFIPRMLSRETHPAGNNSSLV
jgi:glycosyltransferase 2 family protein